MHRTSAGGPQGADPGVRDYRQAAFRIVGAQAVVTVVVATAALWWRGSEGALSALVGGGICARANASFAARMFRGSAGSDPRRLVRAFYAGEVMKIALTAGLFAVAFVAADLDVLVMIAAYLAATLVFWFALVASDGRQDLK